MSRQCARPGCSTAASATLLFDYRARTSSLEPLSDETHPMAYDLCETHADALTVPRGWRLDDNRDTAPAAPASTGTAVAGHHDVRRPPPVPPFEAPYVYN
jgi:Protein of unknown function (DUF3499)